MATKTMIETWPMTEVTKEQVEAELSARRNAGATSCDITEDGTNWVLTCKWPVIQPSGS